MTWPKMMIVKTYDEQGILPVMKSFFVKKFRVQEKTDAVVRQSIRMFEFCMKLMPSYGISFSLVQR